MGKDEAGLQGGPPLPCIGKVQLGTQSQQVSAIFRAPPPANPGSSRCAGTEHLSLRILSGQGLPSCSTPTLMFLSPSRGRSGNHASPGEWPGHLPAAPGAVSPKKGKPGPWPPGHSPLLFPQEFGDHPNIVRLLDVIPAENDRDIYLVFESMGE